MNLSMAAHLDVVVVIVDAGAQLDLLDLDDLLLLARLVLRFCSSYLYLPKSRILQTGGSACGRHLDQIEAGLGGPGQGLVAGDDADHFAALVHQAHPRASDLLVDARPVAGRRDAAGGDLAMEHSFSC